MMTSGQVLRSMNAGSNDIICRGKVEVCFYDQNKDKPIAFPENLLKVFKNE